MKNISRVQWRRERQLLNENANSALKKTKSSCNGCEKNYCCVNQKIIEVFDMEFDALDFYITDEHKRRAREEMKRTDGLISCPFNDPVSGECDIYDNRFSICSLHAVISPVEDCDSIVNDGGETLVLNKMEIVNLLPGRSKTYMDTLFSKRGEDDIIAQFKRVYGE